MNLSNTTTIITKNYFISFHSICIKQIAIVAPKHVKPGQAITFNITAEPASYVSILAVDLSVYLYDRSYDLDKQQILNDLAADKSFVSLEKEMYWPGLLSGLIVMTNAQMPFLSDFSELQLFKFAKVC